MTVVTLYDLCQSSNKYLSLCSVSMVDVTNAGESERCLDIARQALQTGDSAKAVRFAEKALKLHPHDEVSKSSWLAAISCTRSSTLPMPAAAKLFAATSGVALQARKVLRAARNRAGQSSGASSARPPSGTSQRSSTSSARPASGTFNRSASSLSDAEPSSSQVRLPPT